MTQAGQRKREGEGQMRLALAGSLPRVNGPAVEWPYCPASCQHSTLPGGGTLHQMRGRRAQGNNIRAANLVRKHGKRGGKRRSLAVNGGPPRSVLGDLLDGGKKYGILRQGH